MWRKDNFMKGNNGVQGKREEKKEEKLIISSGEGKIQTPIILALSNF